jgi:Xaa-Pro aminopeptidase
MVAAAQDTVLTDIADRLARARAGAAAAGIDALVITPGTTLRYLAGYEAIALERLTALVLPVDSEPWLVAPALERAAAAHSVAAGLGVQIRTWTETEDPVALLAADLRDAGVPAAGRIGVDDRMWTEKSLRLRAAAPDLEQVSAGLVVDPLRIRKTAAEVAELAAAGAAIDRVHARMGEWLRPGRTEREVAADICTAILAEGHVEVDFAIVASGPNGGSPHHHVSDRVIDAGDAVVVDIGGMLASGYRSDCTRVYCLGTPDPEFVELYAVLKAAQAAGVQAVRPGAVAADLDAAARTVIAAAGYGELFTHRLGHGIGLDGHEPPWIVAGNDTVVESGYAFSVEPGIYDDTRWGARLEDIVVVTDDGVRPLNTGSHDFVVLDS